MFPNSNDSNSDTLTLRVGGKVKGLFKGLKARKDGLDEFRLAPKEIADKFRNSFREYQFFHRYKELTISTAIKFPGQLVP